MGSGNSRNKDAKGAVNPFPDRNAPVRHWTREEVLAALKVTITPTEDGRTDGPAVHSGLLDLLRGKERTAGVEFTWTSIYDPEDPLKAPAAAKARGDAPFETPAEDRAYGALLGMAVGDALGACLEFLPVDYDARTVEGMPPGPGGKFLLQPGQWTDDTSLGLCLADSLLTRGGFDGHDLMHRVLAWWYCGMNNAARFEHSECDRDRTSVGLGSNMKCAMTEYVFYPVALTDAGTQHTSGNGSLMRLAAVPVFYRADIAQAEDCARKQSLVTHQGVEAAECCRLMAHIMVRGIAGEDLRDVLESLPSAFTTDCPSVRALAASQPEMKKKQEEDGEKKKDEKKQESKDEGEKTSAEEQTKDGETTKVEGEIDPDRNWNWKAADFRYSPTRAKVNPGYIGSYAMDAMAMALHVLWSTESFPEAVLRAVNLRGDADTLGAIVAQIGGCFYGCSAIPVDWKRTVMRWDGNEIALRAAHLYSHTLLQ